MFQGKSKKFRDTIHGYIEIPEVIVSNIIDTEQFQRLRCIEQTSMRSLYPAARHDRFIHSLGVYWLGRQAFSFFRQNSKKELSEIELGNLNEAWWNKQEILFSLASLLHDCAHAPFSHTLEVLYDLKEIAMENGNLYGFEENTVIRELDLQLLRACMCEGSFLNDFIAKDGFSLKCSGKGQPHEKMSAFCVMTEYKEAIKTVCKEILEEEIDDKDIVYIARMIIGCTYLECDMEKSVKNCIISMLNSSSIDVDSLDYIVRDAYMSGIDNFSIDYQRLLSSFTVIPIEVFNKQIVEEMDLDGLWLEKSRFNIRNLSVDRLGGELRIENVDMYEREKITGLDCAVSKDNRIISTSLENEIAINHLRQGRMQLVQSCTFTGSRFTGEIIYAKRVIPPLCVQNSQCNHKEYILGFDKNSLSIIQSTVEARNHEYLWVYAHPKVLYSSIYLQLNLLRNSAKYLCCCANNKNFKNVKLNFDCEHCEYHDSNKDTEEDWLLYIMGISSYFKGNKADVEIEDSVYQKMIDNGFLFYRTCDDDLNALFKRIYIENKKRMDLKAEKIDADFKEFFSRKHKRPLWKSFVEYDNILKLCKNNLNDRGIIPKFCKKIVSQESIYKSNYAELPLEYVDIFKEYKLTNVIIIKSSVKTKELNPYQTFIKFNNQILRLSDIFNKENRKERISKEFYYIFADMEEPLDNNELLELFRKLSE